MDTAREYYMTDLLALLVNQRAEELSVTPGQPPALHIRGEVHRIEGPSVSPEHASSLLRSIADTRQMRELHEHGRADFLFSFHPPLWASTAGSSRLRVTARTQHDEVHFQIHATA